jgi:hypothetical protein
MWFGNLKSGLARLYHVGSGYARLYLVMSG